MTAQVQRLLTIVDYAKMVGRGRNRIGRWFRAASVGDKHAGGGVVVEEQGRRWIAVPASEAAKATTDTEPAR